MIVYSKKIVQFIQEIKSIIVDVLSKEIGLKISKGRFYNRENTISYPIKIVIYNNKRMLGYFDADFYEMGFHQCLMHARKSDLKDVIRHELAHYMVFIKYGIGVKPHGEEFKAFCKEIGWDKEVSKATIHLLQEENIFEVQNSAIFRKIQKLMALSTSSNPHEAEQAMIKSQQLLLKHNIEAYSVTEENFFLKRLMKQKKETAKMRAIGKILETFFVHVVYSRGQDFICLEILGDAINIEIAEYVAHVLDIELEKLWKQAQQQAYLSGTVAKNSFFLGIAKGYCNKIEAFQKVQNTSGSTALIVIEKKLAEAKMMAYDRLSSKTSRRRVCKNSSSLGEQIGKKLSINPGIRQSSSDSIALISYRS